MERRINRLGMKASRICTSDGATGSRSRLGSIIGWPQKSQEIPALGKRGICDLIAGTMDSLPLLKPYE